MLRADYEAGSLLNWHLSCRSEQMAYFQTLQGSGKQIVACGAL